MEKPNGPGRPADRQRAVARELRERIVRGELAPGAQLPPHVALEEGFGVSAMTVQRALEQLKRDGFVRVQGKRGTFVVDAPPHLSRYALVFPQPPDSPGWTRFWTALAREAERESDNPEHAHELPSYYAVDGHEDSEDYARLVRDVRAHRVAGLIFASVPHLVRGTPLLTEPGVARACIAAAPQNAIPTLWVDMDKFFERAFDRVREAGRTRVAFLNPAPFSDQCHQLLQQAAQHGLQTRPFWCHSVNLSSPATARELVHLLMHDGGQERPDALIISDDNLLEPATQGLRDAGVRAGQIEIVAHCNFPYPTPALLPVARLGFDTRFLLRACVSLIDAQRNHETVPPFTLVPPLFEGESAAPATPPASL